ncbi:MAG: hypothetical protein V7631_4051, partial [Massilia sp.]
LASALCTLRNIFILRAVLHSELFTYAFVSKPNIKDEHGYRFPEQDPEP